MTIRNQPKNFNFAKIGGFRLVLNRIPNVVYFCQSVTIPGLNLGETRQPTPNIQVPIPGDTIDYDSLNVRFKLDEDMLNYIELFNWMVGLGAPEDMKQYSDYQNLSSRFPYKARDSLSDGSVIIETAAKNPNIRVDFKDLWPTNLSSIEFNTVNGDDVEIDVDATFRYSYFNISTF